MFSILFHITFSAHRVTDSAIRIILIEKITGRKENGEGKGGGDGGKGTEKKPFLLPPPWKKIKLAFWPTRARVYVRLIGHSRLYVHALSNSNKILFCIAHSFSNKPF